MTKMRVLKIKFKSAITNVTQPDNVLTDENNRTTLAWQ